MILGSLGLKMIRYFHDIKVLLGIWKVDLTEFVVLITQQ